MDRSLFAPTPSARETLIRNERIKLTGSYVDTVAGGVFTVGGLAPIFAVLYGATSPTVPIWVVVGIAIICWIVSAALHWRVRIYLRELA